MLVADRCRFHWRTRWFLVAGLYGLNLIWFHSKEEKTQRLVVDRSGFNLIWFQLKKTIFYCRSMWFESDMVSIEGEEEIVSCRLMWLQWGYICHFQNFGWNGFQFHQFYEGITKYVFEGIHGIEFHSLDNQTTQ